MARKEKEGLDYFPMDTDFFEDDKIQLIEAEFGAKGLIITMKLMCKIYKEGYFYQWGDDECLLFSKKAGTEIVPKLVEEVIQGLIRRSFFDKGVFDLFKILTSKGIQKRYFAASERRKKVLVTKEFLLCDVSEFQNISVFPIDVNILTDNVNINEVNVNINPQREKEKKVKEKERESKNLPAPDFLKIFDFFKKRIKDFFPVEWNSWKTKYELSLEKFKEVDEQIKHAKSMGKNVGRSEKMKEEFEKNEAHYHNLKMKILNDELEKFSNYYEGRQWKTGDGALITDINAVPIFKSWLGRKKQFETKK